MRTMIVIVAVAMLGGSLGAQEEKPVPKDSVRVSIPGCTKGYVFTAGHRTADQPGSVSIPEGLHLRMNGAKKTMGEIKAHEGSMIEITGIMKRGQYGPDGISLGGGVRITGGQGPAAGGSRVMTTQVQIDVEGWRPAIGDCPSR